ncbi:MAG: ornithine cyclodeaminase family protein [Candidatus Bathyarchaeota archaeon]|nr:ornithine cyclodeaminase family protein [Candidatus Bathyarchaeota archaeon]
MNLSEEILYLSRTDVEKLNISIEEIIKAVENAFREKAAGKVEMPPKPGIHPRKDAFIHAMPAFLKETNSAGMKWVSGFPENPKRGLPYVSGLIVLNDTETGFPICVMDCTWVTAKRTGAATAVAAKCLANRDAEKLEILGCGAQGRSNLEALLAICRSLKELRAYDVNKENLGRYVKEMTAKHGVHVAPAESPRQTVEDCDIVASAGPILITPHPVIEASWFKNGGFACALDFDSYWKPEAMHSMDKFCTDDRKQFEYYKMQRYLANAPRIYAELSEVVAGKKAGREHEEERIMSMNLGIAIEDIATAKIIYEKAKKTHAGNTLQL